MLNELIKRVFFFSNFIEVLLTYDVLISDIQPSDSVVRIYILFHILFHYVLEDIEYSSLSYIVGPRYLPISICNSERGVP